MTPTGLSVHTVITNRGINATLTAAPGRVLALLGRNGAGKTTILNTIAGLLVPDDGHVRIGTRTLLNTTTWVPPHRRNTVLLAQHPLLFPHLTVLENVAFGPRAANTPKKRAHTRAHETLELVQMGDHAHRRPAQLSSGQAQRVALARALATDPQVLLLDEPLAALDVDSATQIRALLRNVLHNERRTTILVTHHLADVQALADDVVVLEDGRIVEAGTADDVLAAPCSDFLRSLTGEQPTARGNDRQAEPVHS